MATTDRPQPQTAKRDFRQEATDAIIRMLEEGVAPWQKPWQAGAIATPFNPTTEKPYRGGNAVYLMAVAVRRGYDDPRWMSYKQAQQRGWQVRRGEIGTQIEYWEFPSAWREREQRGSQPDSDQGDKTAPRMIHRIYTVFNAKQIDGIPPYTPKQRQEFQIVRAAESVLEHSGARILHDQNDRAFYNRIADSIHLPPKAAFSSVPDYYGTALHELAHWTGHPSRLNRPTLTESYRFGDLNYAQEELRAELASLFLAAERAIPHNPASHAAYVGSWLQALRPVCKLSRTSNSYSLDSAPPHLRHRRRRGCWHRLLGVGWQARERDKDRHHVWRRLCRHRHTAAEALDQVNGSTKCIAA